MRVVVLPQLGGKIYSIVSKVSDTELLWHNPRVNPKLPPFGANFDNYFTGGWDHPFPTLAPCGEFPDREPYIGELWSLPWEAHEDLADPSNLTLRVDTVIVPCQVECRIRLEQDRPRLSLAYSITNVGWEAIDLTWGLHPCLAIEQGTQFRLPVSKGEVMQSEREGVGREGDVYSWPLVQTPTGTLDMSRAAPASSCVYGLHQFTLDDGWFEVERTNGTVARFSFPTDVFPIANFWVVYGGWRGIYHAAIEPWSSRALSLEQAAAIKETIVLDPDQTINADVHMDLALP